MLGRGRGDRILDPSSLSMLRGENSDSPSVGGVYICTLSLGEGGGDPVRANATVPESPDSNLESGLKFNTTCCQFLL
jgi:hypothetical protein